MSIDDLAHDGVMHKTVIAEAAILADHYTNDERKGIMAQEGWTGYQKSISRLQIRCAFR